MVRARLEVGADRFGDLPGAAVRDHGVDQAVRAAVGDVLLGVAELEQVAWCSSAARGRSRRTRGRARAPSRGPPRPRRRPRARRARPARRARGRSGVCSGVDEVRVRAERALLGQVEHLRPERGGQTLVLGHRRLGGVEAVEELAHRLQRARVVARRLRVADADAEQEAVRVVARELGVVARDVRRVVLPDVEDAGDDRERRRRLDVRARLLDRRAAAEPERAVAERLELGLGRRGRRASAAPDADSSEFHAGIVAVSASEACGRRWNARNQPATPAAISDGISGTL